MKDKILSVLKLFLVYLKIGLFTFGGGYAMIALIEDEIVSKRNWITKEELTDIVTIAESTPGPIAINCSTYVGYKIAGIIGSIFATLGVVIPSFVIIFVISLFFDAFLQIEIVAFAFNGIKCAVGIIIIRTGLKMFKNLKKNALNIICFVVAVLTILAVNIFAVNFSAIWLILIGAVIGIFIYAYNKIKHPVSQKAEDAQPKLSCRQIRKQQKEKLKQEKLVARKHVPHHSVTEQNDELCSSNHNQQGGAL